jgi:hypothetical protein
MNWWTSVAALTPIVVVDANNVSGSQMLDYIGSNNLSSTSTFGTSGFKVVSVAGNGGLLSFASPVTLPTDCVVAALVKPARRWVGLGSSETGYILHQNDTNNWYSSNQNNTAATSYGATASYYGQVFFAAIVKTGSTSQLFVNGSSVGAPVAGACLPNTLSLWGYSPAPEYNLDSDEFLSAVGIWSGAATQAELVTLEAAVRASLVGASATYRSMNSALGLLRTAPPQALDGLGVRNKMSWAPLIRRDVYFGGNGRIVGTVKLTPNLPARRRVRLIHEVTGILIGQTWSDAQTGAYAFENIDLLSKYTVMSYDHEEVYRAVVADRVMPELMPEQGS